MTALQSCSSRTPASFLAALLGFVATVFGSSLVHAQGFALHAHPQPPSGGDGLALQLPSTPGHLKASALLTLDLALSPLVATADSASDADADILGHRIQAHGAFALGLGEQVELFAVLPLVLNQGGDDPVASGFAVPAPASEGLGDVALGASARVVGRSDDGAQLGVTASLLLPTGSKDALVGDGGVGARAGLMFALGDRRLRFAVETGAHLRPELTYGQTEIGSQLYARGGAHFGLSSTLRLMVEAHATSRLSRLLAKYESPAEALVGVRYESEGGLLLGAGAGLGLTQAPGVPAFRALLTVGYALTAVADGNRVSVETHEEQVAPPPVVEPAPVNLDGDNDGIADADDRCLTRAEDNDNFEDDDGCPDEDNDRDGVPDAQDRCPNEAEEMTGAGDGDGCPGSNQLTEPKAETEEPPAPAEAEQEAAAPSARRPGWQVVQDALPASIPFEFQSEALTPEAERTLIELAALARRYPRVRLSVEGHASLEGDALERTGETRQRRGNHEISQGRAERVGRLLIARGVRAESVVVRAFGATRPVASNDDESGRAQNRRVEIRVLR